MPFLNIFSKKKIKQEKEKPRIIVDIREKNSLVIAELHSLNCEVELKNLEVADYLIQNTAIERKTSSDFISSMLSKRLIQQLHNMQQYQRKLLIIEGKLEKTKTNIHENAIKGMLLSISLEANCPIIYTKNPKDTASFLYVLAKKQENKPISLHSRIPKNTKQQQKYILESFQGIGPKTAEKLLKHYKTIKNIINADIEKLKELIGKKAQVFKILDEDY